MGYKTYKSREEMKADGYVFEGSSECKKCGARVEWAKTPRGKKIPYNAGSTLCHFDTCGKPGIRQQAATAQPTGVGSQRQAERQRHAASRCHGQQPRINCYRRGYSLLSDCPKNGSESGPCKLFKGPNNRKAV
ncbi:MAG TPA: hypothetical protein VL177_16350 [Terriglobales bacterium]|nr:hypothetical protein [Terriglobales bacterium]